jgi:predicted GNAT superfamily acetyltransferase
MDSCITIRHCDSHEDLRLCVQLQREIWGYDEEDLVPAAMFVVAQHTGGHALCAFEARKPIGFALAYSAEAHGRRCWHSHMVGVLPEYQNRGVGRLLKLRQREEGLKAGLESIQWTFDPLELRNAHFNLARLGVVVRHYITNCYGETTSPLHGGLPTDRLVAEWWLDSARVEQALQNKLAVSAGPSVLEIPLSTDIRELKTTDPARVRELQADLRKSISEHLATGYAVTGFRRGSGTSHYVLEPYED